MFGICAIVHKGGLSVSNDAILDADKYLIEIDGVKHSKQVLTLKINAIFNFKEQLELGDKVEGIFKSNEEKKTVFTGNVKSIGKQLTVIHELEKIDYHYYNEILNKIKSHGKHN